MRICTPGGTSTPQKAQGYPSRAAILIRSRIHSGGLPVGKIVLRSADQYVAFSLHNAQHRFSFSLILPQISEEDFILRFIFAHPFQAPFDEALNILGV